MPARLVTEEQADAFLERLDEHLKKVVEDTQPGSSNWVHNTDNSDISSVSDIEDELDDYFADAGDYYFGDDNIDVDIRLSVTRTNWFMKPPWTLVTLMIMTTWRMSVKQK